MAYSDQKIESIVLKGVEYQITDAPAWDEINALKSLLGTTEDSEKTITEIIAELEQRVTNNATSITELDTKTEEADNALSTRIDTIENTVASLTTSSVTREVVDALPAVEDARSNVIYMVLKNGGKDGNIYSEYLFVPGEPVEGVQTGTWELIGDTETDLSNYYTKDVVDTELAKKANTTDLADVAFSGAYSDLTGTPTIETALSADSEQPIANKTVTAEVNRIDGELTTIKEDVAQNTLSIDNLVSVQGTVLTFTLPSDSATGEEPGA